jgi:hypothetical protein
VQKLSKLVRSQPIYSGPKSIVSAKVYSVVLQCKFKVLRIELSVPDPGKGVCADPVKRGAILEGEGPGPPGGDKERQLSPDRGRGKT